MTFSEARWAMLKRCEMNARQNTQCPEMLKMAQNIIIDPWPQSDWDTWLMILSGAMTHDQDLYSYLFLVRGCGTTVKENPDYGLSRNGWPYIFIPHIGPQTWPTENMFTEMMSDMFSECDQQLLYQIMIDTWDYMKQREKHLIEVEQLGGQGNE